MLFHNNKYTRKKPCFFTRYIYFGEMHGKARDIIYLVFFIEKIQGRVITAVLQNQ